MNGPKIYFTIPLFGGIPITQTTVSSFAVMLLLCIAGIVLGSNLQKRPSRRQVLVEKGVTMLYGMVEDTMGKHNSYWTPYIGALFLSSIFGSYIGMTGIFRSSTADLSTTVTWALMTSVICWACSIKANGVLGWLKGFTEPVVVMTPMNLVSEIAQPISMAFRHFGNIAGGNGGSRKPPRDEDDAPRKAKGRKSGKKGGSGKGGNGKKKKKIRWWQILLITLLVIALIFGGAFALIMGAITPAGGNIKLNQLINTPKEFQGKEFNILVTGVDRSSTGDLSAGAANDSNVNDGMTDMILYVHFNNETGEMKMLQIPRDTMVTTDTSVSGNFRINGVAKTQGSDGNNNMAALCELVADQYKLPIDGFMTIRLEMLTELVDLFGGVEINVPVDVDYAALGLGDSVIHAGYQTLNGASMEFLLRARKIYPDGDIGRLNMQRQFYAALFRKLKSIGNIWDVAKLTPAVLNYMETNLSASDLISFAISMLKIDSSKIMICQMPVISGPQYNGQSLLYPARQADADLLNQYFRENTGPVDASQLNLCDNVIDLSGYTATDPNIQQMGGLMAAADDAQKDPNQNLDGSNQVTDIMASESTAESESTDTDSTDTESQPAA